MEYEENMYRTLDNIIDLQHRIMSSIINMAESEVARKPVRQIEESLLQKEFEALSKQYIELRERMNNYKVESFKEKRDLYAGSSVTVYDEEAAKKDDNLIVDVRDDAIRYIREAYYLMQFIDNDEIGEDSIYQGERSKDLRDLEYDSYRININAIESKDDLDRIDSRVIPYRYRAIIIEDLAQKKAYEQAYSRVSRIVSDVDNPEKFKSLNEEERKKFREALIYKKYEEKYKMLNQRYNGVLTDEVKITQAVNSHLKLDSLPLFLGVSKEDFDKLYEALTGEYLEGVKDDMKEMARDVKMPRKSKQTTAKKLLNNIREASSNTVSNILKGAKREDKKGEGFDAR